MSKTYNLGKPTETRGARRITLGAILLSGLDSFIPDSQSGADLERTQRSRLLVAISFGLAFVALVFLIFIYQLQGQMAPNTWATAGLGALFLLNPFFLRWTGSYLFPGTLLPIEVLVSFAIMASHNGGYDADALLWL